MQKLKLQYLAIWCEKLTPWKRPWCWKRLQEGAEGDDRGWAGWMASPTQWMWVWVSSRSWLWTGKPGMLQSMGLQRTRHDWTAELNWNVQTSSKLIFSTFVYPFINHLIICFLIISKKLISSLFNTQQYCNLYRADVTFYLL